MNRPVRKAFSRAAGIILALLVAYLAFSMLSLALGRGDWIMALLALVGVLAIGAPFVDKAFGDKLPFLKTMPTPSANAKFRRILSAGSPGSNYAMWKASSKKEIIIAASFYIAPFFILMALGAIISLFRPISDTYFRIAFATLYSVAALPGTFGATFRLRKKFDLKNTLAAIFIFSPISAILFIAFFMLNNALDGDGLRLRTDILILSCCASLFITAIFTVMMYLRVKDAAPAPAFTTRSAYKNAEITLCVASLAAVATLMLFASQG